MQAWINSQLTRAAQSYNIDGMSKPYTPATYRKAFVERVRSSRIQAGKSPLEMAKLLGVRKDTYHRYETRTLMPHNMVELFCKLTGAELHWLVTGQRLRLDGDSSPVATRKLG